MWHGSIGLNVPAATKFGQFANSNVWHELVVCMPGLVLMNVTWLNRLKESAATKGIRRTKSCENDIVPRHTRAHCNTATHCNTLQHTATHYDALQHNAAQCSTPQRIKEQRLHFVARTGTVTHCSHTLPHTATRYNTLQSTATRTH